MLPANDCGPLVPVLWSTAAKAWPTHPEGAVAHYAPLARALSETYTTDAHFAAYSAPAVARRLDSDAPAQLDGVDVVLFVIDVDCPEAHRDGKVASEAWRAVQRQRIDALRAAHPEFFGYDTRGGLRLIVTLADAHRIEGDRDSDSVLAWRRWYGLRLGYLWRVFGIEADPTCRDWTRLYRLPHATRTEGAAPESWPVYGTAPGVWTYQATADEEARNLDALRQLAERDQPTRGERGGRNPWADAFKHAGGVLHVPRAAPTPTAGHGGGVSTERRGSRVGAHDRARAALDAALPELAAEVQNAAHGAQNITLNANALRGFRLALATDDPAALVDVAGALRAAALSGRHPEARTDRTLTSAREAALRAGPATLNDRPPRAARGTPTPDHQELQRDPSPDGAERRDTYAAGANDANGCDTPSAGSDPLEDLAERIRAEGNPSLAFDPVVVNAACELQQGNPADFDALRRALKAAGVHLSGWDAAVKARGRELRTTEKAAAQREGMERARAKREALERQRIERAAERQREREAADNELAAHYADVTLDGAEFSMVPGRITRTTVDRRGEEHVVTLANFSAPIVSELLDFESPGAAPVLTYGHSVRIDGESAARAVEVSGKGWERGDWLGAIATHAAPAHGMERADLLRALRLFARVHRPTIRRRYGFTGWIQGEDTWRYVHAGEGGDAAPEGIGAKYALPPAPEGAELHAALDRVFALASVQPANVVLPLLGAVFRSVLGPSRCTVHVFGRGGLRKTTLVQLCARFFGSGVEYLSWANGRSEVGLTRSGRIVGDAVRLYDDLRLTGTGSDDKTRAIFEAVMRAQYDRTSEAKGKRDTQGLRDSGPSRSLLLSTGEVMPQGFTTAWRILSLELMDVSGHTREMMRDAEAGVYASVMAAFIRWLAPRIGEIRGNLRQRDDSAARRWELSGNDRTVELAGELAHGWLMFGAFLVEVSQRHADAFDALNPREALAGVVGAQADIVAGEDTAPRFVELLRDALGAGHCHVAVRTPNGRDVPPERPERWGWRWENNEHKPRGPRVGYLRSDGVAVVPTVALAAIEPLTRKRPLATDERTLRRDLAAADLLTREDTVQVRQGTGVRAPRCLLLKLEAFDEDT